MAPFINNFSEENIRNPLLTTLDVGHIQCTKKSLVQLFANLYETLGLERLRISGYTESQSDSLTTEEESRAYNGRQPDSVTEAVRILMRTKDFTQLSLNFVDTPSIEGRAAADEQSTYTATWSKTPLKELGQHHFWT